MAMRKKSRTSVLIAGVVGAIATAANAAPQAAAPPLRAIDPNVADVNPMSASLRDTRIDLRQPLGFTDVYRVPGQPGLLMRSSGAIFAVFPNSVYARTPTGPLALVPPGTVFYIGLPPAAPTAGESISPHHSAVDTRIESQQETRITTSTNSRIDTLLAEQPRATSQIAKSSLPTAAAAQTSFLRLEPETAISLPTVANDEGYRVKRLSELLERAAKAIVASGAAIQSRAGTSTPLPLHESRFTVYKRNQDDCSAP